MHYRPPYPNTASARDRFIVDLRGPRPHHDPWRYQNLAVEDEQTEDGGVARVGTVFLTGRECPWRCAMCDLWRCTTREDTPAGAISAQVASALEEWRRLGERIGRIKLYNASNFFDSRAVPDSDYEPIADRLASLDQVIVESHPSLIGPRVDRLVRALGGVRLQVAMGLETVHPAALEALNKRMTSDDFARAADDLRRRNVSLRAFVLIHPPFVKDDEQDEWLLKSVTFAAECGASVISLIPTRGGNGAMEALTAQKLFREPTPEEVERSFRLASSLQLAPLSPQPSALTPDPSALSPQPSLLSPQPSPLSPQPSALSPRIVLDPWTSHAR